MLRIRPGRERGHVDHGWLDTHHTFSFADYYDEDHMGFRSLRVINEDVVQPGLGFPRHGHRDMEILTWILAGALEHKDSTGGGGIIRPGEMQYMSAGRGVMHSEYNPSRTDPVHLLQIWIVPSEPGATPRYAQKDFSAAFQRGKLVRLASPDGADESIGIRQDASLHALRAPEDLEVIHTFEQGRAGWLQVARGAIRVNDLPLAAGDGLAIEGESRIAVQAAAGAEFLLFDLA